MYILRVDGTTEELTDTSLKGLQTAVGGYIEIIPTNDKRLMVVDEEGKLKGKEYNLSASLLARGVINNTDIIVGDVVIANNGEIE